MNEVIGLTDRNQITNYRHKVLLSGLKLELDGMSLTRGRSCYSIIKKEFGLKGNRQKVLIQFKKIIEENNYE
tara:strand:+ start:1068 stop:1283 length:216 start_codon:yes stop_codon:yes gene_type:complete